MKIKKISQKNNECIYQIKIKFTNSMLESESKIQDDLNDLGAMATKDLLDTFDTDGTPIVMGSSKWTSKGKVLKEYQTPYGVATVNRHVYQSNKGGKTFCPLEQNARIVVTSTPRFAKQISHKFAENASTQVQEDMSENHNRKVSRSYLQNVADAVGSAVELKEQNWSYMPPELSQPVHHVGVGLDGTCMLLCKNGYRETMVGTIALYDKDGLRQHTTYIAASPEYGKETFKAKMDKLIKDTQHRYPAAKIIGIADGAKENWTFLKKYTENSTIDFWHASEYLTKASLALFPRRKKQRAIWLDNMRHELKHNDDAALKIMTEVKTFVENNKISKAQAKNSDTFLTYFTNNKHRMNYGTKIKNNEPIGSGVTEAACKVIVKQRLCKSGAKWKDKGARVVLSLRSLRYSNTYWDQFWSKIEQYGFPVAA